MIGRAVAVLLLAGGLAMPACAAEQQAASKKETGQQAAAPAAEAERDGGRGRVLTAADIERLVQESKGRTAPAGPVPPATPTAAAKPRPEPRPEPAARPQAGAAFTNEDLLRMFGPAPEGPEPASPAPTPVDPQQLVEEQAARQADAVRQSQEQSARIEELEARVWRLEALERSIHNPYLPRPTLSPEEAAIWANLDGARRAERVARQLQAARDELERARAEAGQRP